MKILLLFLLAGSLFAKVDLKIHEYELDNGLKVLLYPNKQAPIVACRLFYTTGSVHEAPGRSGIAHLLEHVMFKGTKKVGIKDTIQDAILIQKIDSLWVHIRAAKHAKDSTTLQKHMAEYDKLITEHRKIIVKDELWETLLRHGGTGLNAFTSDLMTAYFVTLPKNKVELYLWLEADRMENAIFREFYPERDVVREERRMRYDDSPYGRYYEALIAMFYEEHPYRIPTIGWAHDIENLTREQATEHYVKYYKPNNAILVLAGDIDVPKTKAMIHKYFSPIKPGESHAKIIIEEPEQLFQKRLHQVKDEVKPRVDVLFQTPGVGNKDLFTLDIIEGVLSGKSGRLYKRLVLEDQLATNVSAGNYITKYISSFQIAATLKEGVKPQQVEDVIWEELEKLKNEKISEREMQKVKNQVYARTIRSLTNLENVATELAFYELYSDWTLINTFPEGVNKVKEDEVQEIAKKYFQISKSTVGNMTNPVPGKAKK